jgi:branched-chain amino acid transport system permease protein
MSPPTFTIERASGTSRAGLAIVVAVSVLLCLLPFTGDRASMRLLVEISYVLALAQMWNLLAGYAGLLSVGQQAFVGFGGYMLFALATYANVSPILAMPIVGVLTGLLAIPIALLMFRLTGPYFAIGTWVVAEVFRYTFFEIHALGGGSGMSLPLNSVRSISADAFTRETIIYYSALAIVFASVLIVYVLLRSRLGLGLTALRDSERASASVGIDTFRLKLSVFVAVAAFTGMIGAMIFLQKLRISPIAAFDVMEWSATVIFIVVIGGIGRIEGPFIGVAVYFLLRELMADFGSWYLITLGLAAIIIMLFARQGLWGLFAERTGISIFPVSRTLRLQVPEQAQASPELKLERNNVT